MVIENITGHYTPKNPNSKKSFQDYLKENYQVIDECKEGKTNHAVFHINSCTVISRHLDSIFIEDFKESVTIVNDSLNQLEFTKNLLETKSGYGLELKENVKK